MQPRCLKDPDRREEKDGVCLQLDPLRHLHWNMEVMGLEHHPSETEGVNYVPNVSR